MEILIPFQRPGILIALAGLMFQEVSFSVIIRDDGFDTEFDEFNDLLITGISKRTKVKIIRNMNEKQNVLNARKELFEESKDDFIVYLDSDMLIPSNNLSYLLGFAMKNTDYTFYQGAVLEINSERYYANDINVLGSQYAKDMNNLKNFDNVPTYFGNGAIVGYWRKHLVDIWEDIQVDDLGLGGTDALISAMACQKNNGIKGIALPFIAGYHYAKNKFRRNWEVGADRFVFERLKNIGVSENIYKDIYKHLR